MSRLDKVVLSLTCLFIFLVGFVFVRACQAQPAAKASTQTKKMTEVDRLQLLVVTLSRENDQLQQKLGQCRSEINERGRQKTAKEITDRYGIAEGQAFSIKDDGTVEFQ